MTVGVEEGPAGWKGSSAGAEFDTSRINKEDICARLDATLEKQQNGALCDIILVGLRGSRVYTYCAGTNERECNGQKEHDSAVTETYVWSHVPGKARERAWRYDM